MDDGHCQCWEHGGSEYAQDRKRRGRNAGSDGGHRYCAEPVACLGQTETVRALGTGIPE